ncbi:Ig-like domain-containing protein [Rahnella ecdela]|uniref:Bacterial Ig-like domain-containing protein n=1 Tax=Rahnella ecdela TaxID=2816250 RepID=A0ABS6LAE1_9GAMM|nr:Ig-like domain-containing protein [Rahnella ecdela]MBU9843762.1 hypothetical protein [Rahnella ecdela]
MQTSELISSQSINGNSLVPTPAEPGVINIDAVTDDVGATTGVVNNFGYTDDLKPTLSGFVAPELSGTVIQFFINTIPAGFAEVQADGSWSFTPAKLLEPGHEYIFQTVVQDSATDAVAVSLPYTIYTTDLDADDVVAPQHATDLVLIDDTNAFNIEIQNDKSTHDNTPTYTGKAEAGSTVIISDNGKIIGSATVSEEGNWSFTPESALVDGSHIFTTVVVDSAGNKSDESAALHFTIDTGHSEFYVTDAYTADPVHGSVMNLENGESAFYSVNNVANWLTHINLHVGNPDNGDVTSTLYIDGKMVSSKVVIPDANGNYGVGYSNDWGDSIYLGTHEFVVVFDQGGNSTSFSYQVQPDAIDTVAPDAYYSRLINWDGEGHMNWFETSDNTTNKNVLTFSGKGVEQHTTLFFYDNGIEIGSTTSDRGTWSFTADEPFANGNHSLTVVVVDPAGNSSEASKAVNFTVDAHESVTSDEPSLIVDTLDINVPAALGNASIEDGHIHLGRGSVDKAQVSLDDILNGGKESLMFLDGKIQVAVHGDVGDTLVLNESDMQVTTWEEHDLTINNVDYDLYRVVDSNIELLVEHGVNFEHH